MPRNKPKVQALYRYPVKGLSAEALPFTKLVANEVIHGDRLYAIEAGTGKFDENNPEYFRKVNFLMLMRDEALANLETSYVDESQMLTVREEGKVRWSACLSSGKGRKAAEDFFARFLPENFEGSPKIVRANLEGFSFSDVDQKVISVVNLSSVRALEKAVGVKLNPMRFRANLYLEGLAPWSEFEFLEKQFSVGGAILEGVKITRRCKAIDVNPETGERDLALTRILSEQFDHSNCGIYCRVFQGGKINVGDEFIEIDKG